MWKNEKFTLTEKNFVKSTTYLVISLVKPLVSRNFCQKLVRVNFRNFHTVLCAVHSAQCRKTKNLLLPKIFSVKLTI